MPQLTLLYDADCPLCRKFVRIIERLDGNDNIEIISVEEGEVDGRFDHIDMARARQELTVCDQLRRPWHGIEAIRRIGEFLPGIRRLSWAYRLPGITPAIGKVYRGVNRQRRRLCLKCGEKWMPSLKTSVRRRRGR